MSDRKTSSTPIIVGAVIAILGILTGLYIATNAREQMQEQNSAESQASAAADETDATPADADITSMPDLPAVDYTPGRVEEEDVVETETEPEPEPVPETPTEVEVKQETATEETLPDVPDDFEPVSAEEIEQALPEQKEQPEETQPTQE